MATIANKAVNTATVTNKEYGASLLTVDDANFLVSEAGGMVATPYGMTNQAANTASITNRAAN